MTDIIRMKSVEPILYGVLKISWADGYEGIVDLRPVLADGDVFQFLRLDPNRFRTVLMDRSGYSVGWIDDDGDDVDMSSDGLRRRAEHQAEILRAAG